MTTISPSPFFYRGESTENDTLAIISLKRDQQVPVLLQATSDDSTEDIITNTRFGSYPHSTLLQRPWGSQIIATNVNAREAKRGKKRKRDNADPARKDESDELPPAYEAAARGFAHIVPPTPELWTVSLPHRTQVVYTPDYSFILQKLRARPGGRIIEAGAGSGSFTHAAARAVFSGYSGAPTEGEAKRRRGGKVCSFEYHEPRARELQREVKEHGLDGVVEVTHRDVYDKGFLLSDGTPPRADMVFLDLPEPRRALDHLVRQPKDGCISPLNPDVAVRICTFSPCIEQVQQTVQALRSHGWVELNTYTIDHRRLDVRRELVSLNYEGLRGVNASAANVEEAIKKLKDVDAKVAAFHADQNQHATNGDSKSKRKGGKGGVESKAERLERIKEEDKERKVWKEGRLSHRTEPELKTHTSYLTFAVLPREWTEDDEKRMREKYATKS